jgi:hypothetical protein
VDADDSGGVRLDSFQQGLLDQVRKTLSAKDPKSATSCTSEQAEIDSKLVDAFMNRTVPLVAVDRVKKLSGEGEEVRFVFSRPTQQRPFGMTLVVALASEKCSKFRMNELYFVPRAPSGKS